MSTPGINQIGLALAELMKTPPYDKVASELWQHDLGGGASGFVLIIGSPNTRAYVGHQVLNTATGSIEKIREHKP